MKILFITENDILESVNNGGGQGSKRNLFLLNEIIPEENIHICVITNNHNHKMNNKYKSFYYKNNKWYLYLNSFFGRNGYNKKIEKDLIQYIDNLKVDVIFFDGSPFGGLSNKLMKKYKIITFMHNIELNFTLNRVKHKGLKAIAFLPVCLSVYYNEYSLLKNSNSIICLNKRDEKSVQKIYKRSPDLIIPVTLNDIFDPEKKETVRNEISTLLFVGSLFSSNYSGIKWFIENVMPSVTCQLIVVGKGMEDKREELERDNVSIIGTVDDLSAYYYQADAVVMPILWGAGMKVKTAEALMFGKTLFATDEALEGYEVDNQSGIFRCNTAEDFILKINEIMSNKSVEKFNPSIRKIYEENHLTEKYVDDLKKILLR